MPEKNQINLEYKSLSRLDLKIVQWVQLYYLELSKYCLLTQRNLNNLLLNYVEQMLKVQFFKIQSTKMQYFYYAISAILIHSKKFETLTDE